MFNGLYSAKVRKPIWFLKGMALSFNWGCETGRRRIVVTKKNKMKANLEYLTCQLCSLAGCYSKFLNTVKGNPKKEETGPDRDTGDIQKDIHCQSSRYNTPTPVYIQHLSIRKLEGNQNQKIQ